MAKRTTKNTDITTPESSTNDNSSMLTDDEFLEQALLGDIDDFSHDDSVVSTPLPNNVVVKSVSTDNVKMDDNDDPLYELLDEAFTSVFEDMDALKGQHADVMKELSSVKESMSTLADLYMSLVNDTDDTDGDDNRIIVNAQKQVIQALLTSPKLPADVRASMRADLMNLDVWQTMTEAQKRINERKSRLQQIQSVVTAGDNQTDERLS